MRIARAASSCLGANRIGTRTRQNQVAKRVLSTSADLVLTCGAISGNTAGTPRSVVWNSRAGERVRLAADGIHRPAGVVALRMPRACAGGDRLLRSVRVAFVCRVDRI